MILNEQSVPTTALQAQSMGWTTTAPNPVGKRTRLGGVWYYEPGTGGNANTNTNPAPPTVNLNDYVGQYKTSKDIIINVSIDGGKPRIVCKDYGIDTIATYKGNETFQFVAFGDPNASCVAKRENGKVVSFTVNIAGQTGVATKVVTGQAEPQPQPQPQQQPQQQANSGWLQCAQGATEEVYQIVIDKSNNRPLGFGKENSEIDAVKAAFPDKQTTVKRENVKAVNINCNFIDWNRAGNLACKIILRKDQSFVSDSKYKRGTYACASDRHLNFLSKELEILDESKIKKIIKEHLYKINL